LDPDNPAAYRRLSRIYQEMDNDTLALKCLERATTLDPLSQTLAAELDRLARSVRHHRGVAGQSATAPDTVTPEVQVVAEELEEAPEEATVDSPIEEAASESPVSAAVSVDDTPDAGPGPVASGAGEAPEADDGEGLFDVTDVAAEDPGPEEADEPFGQVQPQPEWEDTEADPDVLAEPAPSVPLEEEMVSEPVMEADLEADVPEADVPEPEAEPAAADDDEVAALGAGLFEDDADVARAPLPPSTALPTRPAPARPPADSTAAVPTPEPTAAPRIPAAAPDEAAPLPIDLLAENEKDEETSATAPAAEAEAAVSQLPGRHTEELTELLREFGQEDADAGGEGEQLTGEPVATVTLAALYARQGYADQAQETYQRILDTEPENEAARRGLSELNSEPSD
ncbi:MAG: hypothetical protein QF689_17590, partial [Candidatus Latescibacteria bacterium]|nr:hypothetical protein [Candidatus Latescibacterota bacterium]